MGGKLSTKGKKKKKRKIKTTSEPNDSQEQRYEESFEESNKVTRRSVMTPETPFVDAVDEMDCKSPNLTSSTTQNCDIAYLLLNIKTF